MSEHSACPFCGGRVDPTGWLRGDGLRGPECEDCGATARSMEAWESRAEAQALREEPDWSGSKTLCSEMWKSPMLSKQDRLLIADGAIDFRNRVIANLREQLEALRARVVVVPERIEMPESIASLEELAASDGFNACLDELARLNGKAVSEGLLRRLLDSDGIDGKFDAQEHYAAHQELKSLLGEGKEHE